MILARLLSFPFFLIALMVHELSHAIAADRLGDPTPRVQGRLSLNPLKHLDPLGTLMILLVGFGWAKPVMYDPYNFSKPRRDSALVAIAGPASNLLFAFIISALLHFVSAQSLIFEILMAVFQVNIILAVFNLIPVAPLDGSKILEGLLPRDLAFEYSSIMNRYGIFILIFLILPMSGQSAISTFMSPIVSFLFRLFLSW